MTGLAGVEDYEVAVGIGEGYGVFEFDDGDLFFVEMAEGLAEVVGAEDDAGAGAEGGLGDLDFLARVAGHVEEHGVAGDGLEVELVDVEVAGGGGVLHGDGDGEDAVGDAVVVEVLALVVGVEGAGEVLGVLDELALGTGEAEEEVASFGFADRDGGEAAGGVVVEDGVEVGGFEAEMEEGGPGVLWSDGVELEELMVVDLDEGFGDGAVFGEEEGFVEAEAGVEVAGGGDVVDADGYVGYACEGWGLRLRLGAVRCEEEDQGEREALNQGTPDAA